MTDKRYQLRQEQLDYPIVNFYSDLVDTANNDKVICSFELDVGTSEMVDLLNELSEENKRLKEENCQLKREKERYKQLSEIRDENINNRILSLREFINDCEDEKVKNALEDLFYSEVKEYDLAKENRELKAEKEFWKGDACNCSNYLSILSMDCQIVQEAICDLKSVIDVDTEASKLLDELDDKFDELNQHRIKMYSR